VELVDDSVQIAGNVGMATVVQCQPKSMGCCKTLRALRAFPSPKMDVARNSRLFDEVADECFGVRCPSEISFLGQSRIGLVKVARKAKADSDEP
jgi:hypothetical protein